MGKNKALKLLVISLTDKLQKTEEQMKVWILDLSPRQSNYE